MGVKAIEHALSGKNTQHSKYLYQKLRMLLHNCEQQRAISIGCVPMNCWNVIRVIHPKFERDLWQDQNDIVAMQIFS